MHALPTLKPSEAFWLSGALVYAKPDSEGRRPTAVLIENGKIRDLRRQLPEGVDRRTTHVIDMHGCGLFPGLVNAHLHSPMGFFRGLSHHIPTPKPGQTMIENFFYPAESRLTPELIRPLAYSSLIDSLKSGVTCVVDAYFHAGQMGEAAANLGMRSFVGEHIADLGGALPAGRELWERTKKRILNWPHKSLIKPLVYAHATDTVSEPLLKELVQFAKVEGIPFHMHLAQSHGEHQRTTQRANVSPVVYAAQCGALYERALLTHLISLDAHDIKLLGQSGATFAFCPVSEILYEHMPPLKELVAAGMPVALGTDCAASNDTSDMLQELRFTAIMGKHLGLPKSALVPRELLAWATGNASKVLGLNASSQLAVGQSADLFAAQIDITTEPLHDMATCLVYSMGSRHVRHVLIDGQWALWNGQTVKLAEATARVEYNQAARLIRERAGLDASVD